MSASALVTEPGVHRRLRLPPPIRACLFDLDGVLTDTASLHESAWKSTFDAFLRVRAVRTGEPFVPFAAGDYARHVDGRPRGEGVRAFLASRGIEASERSVRAIGDRKNELVGELMRREGVTPFEGSVRFARTAREAGLRLAVVSSSANCAAVLAAAAIAGLFELRVDGAYAREHGLRGKPAPDTFLAAAAALGVAPEEAAVFEDALAGVAAGRAGRFGLVVGVDRKGEAGALRAAGADVVVADLAELLEPEPGPR
jgi:beta-phosphoglucomutase family hydrolase